MSNLDILKDWYDRVWVQGDLDSVDHFFTPDTEALGMMTFAIGPEDFKAVAAAVHETIEHVKVSFDRVVEADNWVWAQISARATSKFSEKEVMVVGQVMCRFNDGKIVEAYNQFDFMSFFEQLGLLPENTLALCLAGEAIG